MVSAGGEQGGAAPRLPSKLPSSLVGVSESSGRPLPFSPQPCAREAGGTLGSCPEQVCEGQSRKGICWAELRTPEKEAENEHTACLRAAAGSAQLPSEARCGAEQVQGRSRGLSHSGRHRALQSSAAEQGEMGHWPPVSQRLLRGRRPSSGSWFSTSTWESAGTLTGSHPGLTPQGPGISTPGHDVPSTDLGAFAEKMHSLPQLQ